MAGMEREGGQSIASGLAAVAVTISEMGLKSDEEARAEILSWMAALEAPSAKLALDAAAEVSRLPQPPSMSTTRAERYERGMKALGGVTPSDQLAAALRAREWLEQIAAELG